MKLNGIFKRVFFFLAAFAIGVGATGLLFGFNMPRWGGGHRGHKKQFVKQLKADKQRLEAENEELRRELEAVRNGSTYGAIRDEFGGLVPPPPPIPNAPAVPHDHK